MPWGLRLGYLRVGEAAFQGQRANAAEAAILLDAEVRCETSDQVHRVEPAAASMPSTF